MGVNVEDGRMDGEEWEVLFVYLLKLVYNVLMEIVFRCGIL